MKKIYLNLKYLIQYHPYHICTFAKFANVTVELLEAALEGNEELTLAELFCIGKHTSVPFSVLTCPKLILLDRGRYKHQVMIHELKKMVEDIKGWHQCGSHEADMYIKYHLTGYESMKRAFLDGGEVSYMQYIGVKHQIQDTLLFISNEQARIRRRGLNESIR